MSVVKRLTDSFLVRLVAGYVLVAIILAAAWLWTLYGPLTDAVLRQQQRNLTAVAQSAALVFAETSSTPSQMVERLVARTDLRMTVVSAEGTVLADSEFDPATMENHSNRVEIATALGGDVGSDRRLSRTADVEELYVAVPGTLAGQRVAIRVSQPLSEIDRIASSTRRSGLVLLLVALVIAVVIGVKVSQLAVRPVDALSDAATRMAGGDLNANVPTAPGDLSTLSDSLITLRDQMQTRLNTLEVERGTLRVTLDGLPDAVLLVAGDKIVIANGAASRLFGHRSGIEGIDLAVAPLPAAAITAIQTGCDAQEQSSVELPADPTGRALRVTVAPLPPAADRRRCIAVIADITERAHLDKMRRDFVANASHELKTPVAGVRLLAQSAETAAADGDTETALSFTRQIETEVERLQRLVADLLDLSRAESAPTSDSVVDLRVAVENALISHRPAATRKGLTLDCDLTRVALIDVFVAADPTDVAIALDNLLENAIAYTDEGGVTVEVSVEDATVALQVADTGPGIDAEHLPRIFERFYRADRGRSREHGGTGLGLALVKHVVERSGGSVVVASTPRDGSTFTLRFPIAR